MDKRIDIAFLMDYELCNSWVGDLVEYLPAWGWLDTLVSRYLALLVRRKYNAYLKWRNHES